MNKRKAGWLAAAAGIVVAAFTGSFALAAGDPIPVTLTANSAGSYDCHAVVSGAVVGCTLNVGPVPTAAPAPTPTATATPSPTATPTATATPTPTATATPTPTDTATPAPTTAGVMPVGVAGSWNLKFDDEFDGTSLDRTKWANCWFPTTCGTMNHVQTPPTNVAVANGELALTLSDSGHGALINSNPKAGASTGYQFATGYVEARIMFPGDGTANGCFNWPAWWTDGQSWPANGEHDIAEVLSGQMTVNYHSSTGAHNQGAVPGTWCGGYHTYGLNRMVGHSDVYFDGQLVKSYTTDDGNALEYLILNVGDGGSQHVYGPGSVVQVDYVRAWQ